MTPAPRLAGVDAARGIALAGMMLVHVGSSRYFDEPLASAQVLGGRAASLFAVLAGVSVMLMHRRDPTGSGSVYATVIRSMLLIGIGLGLGSIEGLGVLVILAYYGVVMILLVPFRRLDASALFVVAGVWAVAAPVLSFWVRAGGDFEPVRQVAFEDLTDPITLVQLITVSGAYPAGVWLAFGLLGMALGRLDLSELRTAVMLLGCGFALVVVTVGFTLIRESPGAVTRNWYGTVPTTSWENLLTLGSHSATPVWVLSAAGSAMAVIGLCGAVVRSTVGEILLRPLRWVGAMPLTFYTAHVLLVWSSGEHGTFLLGEPGWREWFAQVVLFVAFAWVWGRAFGRGPLERAVRFLATPRGSLARRAPRS